MSGAIVYWLTDTSPRVMAAELTADHLKCFVLNSVLGSHHSHESVEASLASRFGWEAHLADEAGALGLELVDGRPCIYGEGRIAHVMYKDKRDGQPVSLFMLPKTRRTEEFLHVFGHEAAIWSAADRTFVLIAKDSRSEVERIRLAVQDMMR